MSVLEMVAWGLLGGLLVEIAGLYELRTTPSTEFPRHLLSLSYWVITGVMVLAGGGLVLVYARSGETLSALAAVNIGASAPLIISRLVAAPPKSLGKVD